MQNGYQLIELMVVVAIIGILVSLSLPKFSHHLIAAHRLEAEKILLEIAVEMEQAQVEGKLTPDYPLHANPGYKDGYRFVVEWMHQRYLLSAVPEGRQRDDECRVLTLNSAGIKGTSGSISRCWG